MSKYQGRFVWYELATTDVAGAVAFYKDVIGWQTEEYEGAGMRYVRWVADGTAVGGVMPLHEAARKNGARSRWMAYVLADDVDAMTKKAGSLGGKTLVEPSDIPNIGRFSVIADPDGAMLALMKPLGPETPEHAEAPSRHFTWNELMAGDRERAFRFYSELFGWQKTDAFESPNGTYQMYGQNGRTLGGMMTRPAGYNAPPHWLYYVKVADLDDALERVKKDGGQIMHGPMSVPDGSRVAQCIDPQGAMFALNGE